MSLLIGIAGLRRCGACCGRAFWSDHPIAHIDCARLGRLFPV